MMMKSMSMAMSLFIVTHLTAPAALCNHQPGDDNINFLGTDTTIQTLEEFRNIDIACVPTTLILHTSVAILE